MTELDVIEKDFDLIADQLLGILFVLRCLLALCFINMVLIVCILFCLM